MRRGPIARLAVLSIALAAMPVGRALADLTLEAGTGPATIALNNYGLATTQTFAQYRSAYGGTATNGFVFQAGQDNSAVGLLLIYNADGSTSLYYDSKVPPYEGNEDSIFAVVNNSSSAINQVRLNAPGSGLAGFDGDGADATSGGGAGYTTIVGPGPSHFGYEGLNSSFIRDTTNLDLLTVNFTTAIAPGSRTFLFVENVPMPIIQGITQRGGGVAVGSTPTPEPSSLALLGLMAVGSIAAPLSRRIRARVGGRATA